MDDEFLKRYRESPRAKFSNELYERIDDSMTSQQPRRVRSTLSRWSPALAIAGVLLAVVLVFSFTPARALAQDFLNLFRVKKFAAITINPAQLDRLKSSNVNFDALLGDDVKKIKEPGKPQQVASADAAAQLAGFQVLVPTTLPMQGVKPEFYVQSGGETQITANTDQAQTVLQALGVDDVQLPAALNGATIDIKQPTSVMLKYNFVKDEVTLMQSPSPEISLPEGVDLAQLGEIGLRAAGMSQADAHQMAQSIDWHSTFLVPVPADAASFREVDVHGTNGLLISSTRPFERPAGRDKTVRPVGTHPASIVLWAQNGSVYALQGTLPSEQMLEMANSLR